MMMIITSNRKAELGFSLKKFFFWRRRSEKERKKRKKKKKKKKKRKRKNFLFLTTRWHINSQLGNLVKAKRERQQLG